MTKRLLAVLAVLCAVALLPTVPAAADTGIADKSPPPTQSETETETETDAQPEAETDAEGESQPPASDEGSAETPRVTTRATCGTAVAGYLGPGECAAPGDLDVSLRPPNCPYFIVWVLTKILRAGKVVGFILKPLKNWLC